MPRDPFGPVIKVTKTREGVVEEWAESYGLVPTVTLGNGLIVTATAGAVGTGARRWRADLPDGTVIQVTAGEVDFVTDSAGNTYVRDPDQPSSVCQHPSWTDYPVPSTLKVRRVCRHCGATL
jgi:hypothetical protein